MKVQFIKCDRCGHEIEPYVGRLVIVIPRLNDRSLDLCEDCWKFFYESFGKNFLKPHEVPLEQYKTVPTKGYHDVEEFYKE